MGPFLHLCVLHCDVCGAFLASALVPFDLRDIGFLYQILRWFCDFFLRHSFSCSVPLCSSIIDFLKCLFQKKMYILNQEPRQGSDDFAGRKGLVSTTTLRKENDKRCLEAWA